MMQMFDDDDVIFFTLPKENMDLYQRGQNIVSKNDMSKTVV